MCTLTGPFDRRSFTGYKVAVKDLRTGKIKSPCMGFIYKPGKVPIIKRQKNLTDFWRNDILNNNNRCFTSNMTGKTAVFIHKHNADYLISELYNKVQDQYILVLILMTITGNLTNGTFESADIVAGTYIKSIKILEEYND